MMRLGLLLLCLPFAALVANAHAIASVEIATVDWRGGTFDTDEFPDDLPAAARSAIEQWADWAVERGYRMALEDEGRVLLLSVDQSSRWRRQMRLITDTLEHFEGALPAPDRSVAAPVKETEEPAQPEDPDAPLPEDPDAPPVPWELDGLEPPAPREERDAYVWGAESVGPDTQTIVFLVALKESDYLSALDFLAEKYEYLKGWVTEASNLTGCALEWPLFGSYVELASGQEEWNPENELVHRTAQLLLWRRFGQQPHWLMRGWCWYSEFAICKAVYCFPFRDEFVWADEHTGWVRQLKSRFRDRPQNALKIEEFATWEHGTYVDAPAKVSWGVVRFLANAHPEGFPRILEDFRVYRDEENRVVTGEGTWERARDFQIPLAVQERVLEEHAGASFFEDVQRYFRQGTVSKPK